MGIRRTSVIACVGAGLWLGACSSDAKTSTTNSADTTTTSTPGAATTTVTTAPVATSTGESTTTTSTATSTATSLGGSTTVTSIAARVVTSPSDNVKLGDSGDGVKQIQTALKAQGYKVSVDGNFGPQTSTAVKSFQKKNGLKQDGIVGPKTWAKLSSAATTSTTTKDSTSTTTTTTG